MERNPVAQTAFGPMVQAAIEQYEPPERRLVDDDLAGSILPSGQRALVHAMRWAPLRRLTVWASERAVPGSWSIIACRKRFIDDRLDEALPEIDAVVILGAGMDTRGYRLARNTTSRSSRSTSRSTSSARTPPCNGRSERRRVRFTWCPSTSSAMTLSPNSPNVGYRAEHRTFFVLEGVTQYLTEDACGARSTSCGALRRTVDWCSPMSARTSSTA